MRRHCPAAGLALLLAAGAAGHAASQTIYRCGPEGREYSQTPCKDGRPIEANDERSPAQRAAARQVAKDAAAEAEQLRRERLAREAEGAKQRAAGFQTAPRTEPPASAPKGKTVKGGKARKPRAAASAARP